MPGVDLEQMRHMLRMDKAIDPSKARFAEMLVVLGKRHGILRGRRKPLRVLADMAHIAPHRLEEILASDVKPRPQTFEKLEGIEGAPTAATWAQAVLGDPQDAPTQDVTDADRAILEATSGWPDEEKYRFAESIRKIQELARAGRTPA